MYSDYNLTLWEKWLVTIYNIVIKASGTTLLNYLFNVSLMHKICGMLSHGLFSRGAGGQDGYFISQVSVWNTDSASWKLKGK